MSDHPFLGPDEQERRRNADAEARGHLPELVAWLDANPGEVADMTEYIQVFVRLARSGRMTALGLDLLRKHFPSIANPGRLDAAIGPLRFITRPEVKRLVCRSSSAKDAHVRAAIIDRFGGPTAIKKGGQLWKVGADTWAAIAVALACADPERREYVPAMLRV